MTRFLLVVLSRQELGPGLSRPCGYKNLIPRFPILAPQLCSTNELPVA